MIEARWFRVSAALLALLLAAAAALRWIVLPQVDNQLNAIIDPGPYPVERATRELHQRLFVADMHADALLWGRDLRRRYSRGQVDLPRLAAGGVDLQVFSVVTQMPYASPGGRYSGGSDKLPLLFVASGRSPATWFSPRQRALAQARELEQLARQTGLTLVLRRGDLENTGIMGLLALEGMHALEGDTAALELFHAAGYRMMGLTHFCDNAVAGSSFGMEAYGLTEFGRELIPRLEKMGITIDLAHASPAAFEQTLELATRPLVVSHGGVSATCPGPRNLSDTQLRMLAANGGVAGIGYWKSAVCDPGLPAILRAIRHAVDIAGIDHVGLGSDFDGAVTTPFDTSGLPQLTAALIDSGYSLDAVAKIMGGNLRRVLAANLPE